MLDRGVIYAIAHIRGGQEMGRALVRSTGTCSTRRTRFTDFIDVTRYLVAQKYAAKGRVAAMGGSAGGLLMGAVANMAPHEYKVIVAQVPFVDVVTTMLDASIPLTTFEYDEWGNPAQKRYLRLHAELFALRQCRGESLSGDVCRHRAMGQPGPILRADQIGRQAARD